MKYKKYSWDVKYNYKNLKNDSTWNIKFVAERELNKGFLFQSRCKGDKCHEGECDVKLFLAAHRTELRDGQDFTNMFNTTFRNRGAFKKWCQILVAVWRVIYF